MSPTYDGVKSPTSPAAGAESADEGEGRVEGERQFYPSAARAPQFKTDVPCKASLRGATYTHAGRYVLDMVRCVKPHDILERTRRGNPRQFIYGWRTATR
jgi:hypothetical protein